MELFKKKEPYLRKEPLVGEGADYHVYDESKKERIIWFLMGFAAGAVVLYIFYSNIFISLVVGAVVGYFFIPIRRKQVIEKRKQKLTLQFRGLLEALATSIGAGKNVYDSFSSAAYDLTVQYGEDSDIVKEVKLISSGLVNNFQIEDLLVNFADRCEIVDVYNFANVFATCYKKGGDIKEVVRNSSAIIGDKIEVQMELETMVAGQKSTQNIMLVMPLIIIVMLRSMGGGLVDLSSAIGMISVTIAIGIFVIAYFISKKILDIKI